MSIRHWFSRGLAALGIAAASAGANAAPATQPARPALWEVSDADTRIYLFGTIHMLPKGHKWQTPRIDKALRESDTLVVETLIDRNNIAPLMQDLARLGFREGLPPIMERVPPAKRAALAGAIARYGVPAAVLDKMETWAAAMTLLSAQFQSLGLKGEEGVEEVLKQRFAAERKPIGQLETNAEQLGYFDALPEASQRTLLVSAVDTPQSLRGQFDTMLRAWTRGDVAAIAGSFNTDLSGSPELLDALLKRRNGNWAKWIRQRLAQPGSVMIAVGAGHLAGKSSVQAMLEQQGYKVKRLQ